MAFVTKERRVACFDRPIKTPGWEPFRYAYDPEGPPVPADTPMCVERKTDLSDGKSGYKRPWERGHAIYQNAPPDPKWLYDVEFVREIREHHGVNWGNAPGLVDEAKKSVEGL